MDFHPNRRNEILQIYDSATSAIRKADVLRNRALLELKMDSTPQAQRDLEQSLRMDPKVRGGHFWLGWLAAYSRNDPKAAAAEFEAEMANNPYSEESISELGRLYARLQRDTSPLYKCLVLMRSAEVTEFISNRADVPYASLFGLGSNVDCEFQAGNPGQVLIAVRMHSTPCDGIYGWAEVRLDGEHIQNLYVDTLKPRTYDVVAPIKKAGKHRLVIQSLSDANNFATREDRNTFIHHIRIYEVDPNDYEQIIFRPGEAFANSDPRCIRNGLPIPAESFVDQPYIVITPDGNWLCTLTTGRGKEGEMGQHVVSCISRDQGRTWTDAVDIEPAAGPEASWATPVVLPTGRVLVFYNYNGDKIHGSIRTRADLLGWYVFKYSDDQGRSWSAQRYRLPMRKSYADRANEWGGKFVIFWSSDKPKMVGQSLFFAFSRLGGWLQDEGEGWFYRADNILTAKNPKDIDWQLLPEGAMGIRAAEYGPVQEDHSTVQLSNGSLLCICRTITGVVLESFSLDGGVSWSHPEPLTYTPGGRRVRNPRACPKIWRTSNGKYLLWFHNNGHAPLVNAPAGGSRGIAWLAGGTETNGQIHWSQPEIVLYDDLTSKGPSYPDLIEQNGRFWISESQKSAARVHALDPRLLEGLWNQAETKAVSQKGLVLNVNSEAARQKQTPMPRLPSLADTGGFSIDVWLKLNNLARGQIIVDSRNERGCGIALLTAEHGALRLVLSDGMTSTTWDSDPGVVTTGTLRNVIFTVDGGPKTISVVADGVLCDGGAGPRPRDYGYDVFQTGDMSDLNESLSKSAVHLSDVSGADSLAIAPAMRGEIQSLRIYSRYLRTSEAVGNWRAGLLETPAVGQLGGTAPKENAVQLK
jgi:tetratricopeptide (TPR) repeat protein